MKASPVTGVILAGGRGSRLGGADKGLVAYRGRPLVAHVRDRLAPQVDRLIVSANRNREAYRALVAEVIPDSIGDFAGPLAGLHAALQTADTDLVVSVPCDGPHLPGDLVHRLRDALEGASADVAIAVAGGREHPVYCLCRRSVRDRLERRLTGGDRRVMDWVRSERWTAATFEDAGAFSNLNRPQDLTSGP